MTLKWDTRFLELAKHIASWSKDPSTQVGAVLTQGKDVVGIGFNGFPKGVNDNPERYLNRELKYKLVVHAEVNACLMAGRLAKGGILYVWPSFVPASEAAPMCNECCKVAIQSGIRELVGYDPLEVDMARAERWRVAQENTTLMLKEAGIVWRGISEPQIIV